MKRPLPRHSECGHYLTKQSPAALSGDFCGTNLMSVLFNLGIVSLLTPLIKKGDERPNRPVTLRNAAINRDASGFAWGGLVANSAGSAGGNGINRWHQPRIMDGLRVGLYRGDLMCRLDGRYLALSRLQRTTPTAHISPFPKPLFCLYAGAGLVIFRDNDGLYFGR